MGSSFQTHWGPFHATHAVRALLGLLIGEGAIAETETN
jgi:hypothetical protein